MFGKKFLIAISCLLLVTLTGGCDKNIKNQDIKEIHSITLSPTENISYKNLDIKEYFSDAKELLYPDNYEFIPNKFIEDMLIVGEAKSINPPYTNHLAIYNIEKQKLQIINSKLNNSESKNMKQKILAVNSKNIIFEQYTAGIARYYIYNIEKEQTDLIVENSRVPELHFSQASLNDEYFALSTLDSNGKTYNIKLYKISDLSSKDISNINSGFPVFYKDGLYYIEIDNEKFTTKLIKYNYKNDFKKDIYSIENKDSYIAFLNYSDNKLLIGIRNLDNTSLYTLNDNEEVAKYEYSSSWMESVDFASDFITYLGDKNIEDRLRMQYYLININDKTNIENKGGPIYLSNKAVLWIEYRFSDKDIPKGQIFNKTYTKMMYKKLN